ncbi:hypothetical protein BGX27_005497, partial [Mortierella sp. AM989]
MRSRITSQIADVAYIISDERQERFFRARSVKGKARDSSAPLFSAELFTTRAKESPLAKEAM